MRRIVERNNFGGNMDETVVEGDDAVFYASGGGATVKDNTINNVTNNITNVTINLNLHIDGRVTEKDVEGTVSKIVAGVKEKLVTRKVVTSEQKMLVESTVDK